MEHDAQLSADTEETKERSLTPPVIMCYDIAHNMIYLRTEPILPITHMSTIRGSDGYIKMAYTYTPYGAVTASGNVTQSLRRLVGGLDKCAAFAPQGRAADGAAASQPIRWSSEYSDSELGLVYYNYRHYNPADGRWTGRDLEPSTNQYGFIHNTIILAYDYLGLTDPIYGGYLQGAGIAKTRTPDITPNFNADAEPVIWNEISLEIAREHYRTQFGRPARISFDMIDTSSVKVGEQFPDVIKWLREHRSASGCCVAATFSFDDARLLYSTKGKEFWVLGSITLKFKGKVSLEENCKYTITGKLLSYDDEYDFNMQASWKPRVWCRNVETLLGLIYHGEGRSYTIQIRGGERQISESGYLS